MKASSLLPAALIVGSLAYGAGAIAGTYGGTFGNGGGGGGVSGALYCALTGCTMTGQEVFSAVSSDISTGTNEDLTLAPNGSGLVEVLKASESGVAEIMSRFTVSDVTATKFMFRIGNATSSNSTYMTDMRSFTNSTTTTLAGIQLIGGIPNTRDGVTNTGVILFNAVTSTDGATGTLAAPTANPLFTVRALATDKFHIGFGGAVIDTPDTLTVADNGGGTNATGTLNPASGYMRCTCNDANGCDITVGETNVRDGQNLDIVCTAATACNFADTAGVTELAGAFACGQYDTLTLKYYSDRWVEMNRSNN